MFARRHSARRTGRRLSVFRSNKHIYVQIIDDVAGLTLASASTSSKALKEQLQKTGNKKAAEAVGEAIAKAGYGCWYKVCMF